jgi:Fe-S-cluster containining protein
MRASAPWLCGKFMLFDHCAQCRRCCHVDAGFPPLEVTLTAKERGSLGSVCIQTQCEHLGAAGCTLGDTKPLSCKLYPLAFDPKTEVFYYDSDCPLMPQYQLELQQPDSDASTHFAAMNTELQALKNSDRKFLTANYRVDSDYFDLRPLQIKSVLKD